MITRLAVLAFAGVLAFACRRGPSGPPIEHHGIVTTEDEEDDPEWSLLHAATANTVASLAPLAAHYQQHAAWDEFSAARTRMLALAEQTTTPDPGPAPGGPFPRIGIPRTSPRPLTVLGHWWVNPVIVPELYAPTEISPRDLEARLREQLIHEPKSRELRARLADVLCVELRFALAIQIYEALLAEAKDPALRSRLAAARRIVNGHR
ncbi:MAG: hypothetical protein ABI867_17110 [Kofleriaceae bacterium]